MIYDYAWHLGESITKTTVPSLDYTFDKAGGLYGPCKYQR